MTDSRRPVRWLLLLAGVAIVSIVLALLPHRVRIPPLVESDYCYLLLAADRFYDGHGLTSLQPVAPLQPWTWRADWAFLTKWPIGYPLLVCAVRWIFGLATIQACQWISVVACAASLIGWFVWSRRVVPHGVTGILLSAVTTGCSVSAASLINPSTDLLLVAALPYVLLLATGAVERRSGHARLCTSGEPRASARAVHRKPDRLTRSSSWCLAAHGDSEAESQKASTRRVALWLAIAGLTAGGLFWIRYAALFVPVAIGAYLVVEWRFRRTIHLSHVAVFALFAALPIVAILGLNRMLGTAESTQAQLNLGHTLEFRFTPTILTTAWWKLTDLGFYDHHWYNHWLFALWPVAVAAIAIFIPSVLRAMRSWAANPAVGLSVLVVVCLLAMLIGATTCFGDKYGYVAGDRYYLPGRPLCCVLFATPILLIRRRFVRVVVCVALVVACSWIVQQEWLRPSRRWLAANREVTPYGQWATCFKPNAADLYRWLCEQASPNLIVVSNFHEYITLETGIPTLPIPPDAGTLDDGIDRICASRGVSDSRVLFVLDPDNKWRSYWLPTPAEIVQTFSLQDRSTTPATVSALVFEYPRPLGRRRPIGYLDPSCGTRNRRVPGHPKGTS